jgi:hypothetical protein
MSQILEGMGVLGGLMVYLIPSIAADARNSKDAHAITLMNILLGWTVIGWIGAFLWARGPAVEKRLTHLVKRTKRSVARATVAKIVAHAEHRASLQRRAAARRRPLSAVVTGR